MYTINKISCSVVHQTAVLGHQVPAVGVAPGQAPLPAVQPAAQVAPRVVPETEDENVAVAKVLMHRGDMKIKKKKGTKKEKGKEIEIGTENEIGKRKRRKEATLCLTNPSLKGAPGMRCIYLEIILNKLINLFKLLTILLISLC